MAEELRATICNRYASGTAKHSEQKILQKKLLNERAAACANRQSHRHFSRASAGTA
jgi:hypothetical protein